MFLQALTPPLAVSKGLTHVRQRQLGQRISLNGRDCQAASGVRAKLCRTPQAVSEGVSDTPVASADPASEQEALESQLGNLASGPGGSFDTAIGEPAGEETFETRVGIVEPVEEDEAEVTPIPFLRWPWHVLLCRMRVSGHRSS